MKVALFQVPYHMGHERVGMGLGPIRLLEQGADRRLRERGHEVDLTSVARPGPVRHEIGAILEINRLLAGSVGEAVRQQQFPLVLAGNCNSCLGTLAGLSPSQVGIIWFDAHGDFNTPETTRSGFFDGMALAAATGNCWKALSSKISDFRPVAEERVLLVGVRDLDGAEEELLKRSRVTVLRADQIRRDGIAAVLKPALARLQSKVQEIYLHLDIDVLDPTEAPANEYSAPGGLSVTELEQAVGMIAGRFAIRAAALTAYNPDYDPDNKTLRVGLRLLRAIVEAAAARKSHNETGNESPPHLNPLP